MRHITLHISLLLMLALSLLSCDKTPHGVMSINDMADLIVDLQLADAYIENHIYDFETDSSKQVFKQSVFKKHGITQQDYDSSLVWYAHNMEDYTRAYDKAAGKLKARYDKLDKSRHDDNSQPQDMMTGQGMSPGEPTHNPTPGPSITRPQGGKALQRQSSDIKGDTADLWQGRRNYVLAQSAKRGFIPFDIQPDANKKPGDRYQLGYKLMRGGNEFKVCLSVDYTDGSTTQIARGTYNDGWISIDVQSDTARQVRRIYGYVSYNIKRGHTAYVDSLMLVRTRKSDSNYGFIHGQRLLERTK